MNAAYREGLYFDGDIDIPIIDWRPYLEEVLDMHNSHQSFAARQRIIDHMGHHDNQLIWFTDARPGTPRADHTMEAFAVLHEWITNIRANPSAGVGANRPASAVDRCWATDGTLIAEGAGVWAGVLPIGSAPRAGCYSSWSSTRAAPQ